MKSSINCLLIGLASFDLILIITSILMFGLPSIYTHSLVTGFVFNNNKSSVLNICHRREPFLAFYFEDIFPFITPFIFPVRW